MAGGLAMPPPGEPGSSVDSDSDGALDGSPQTPRASGEPPRGDERYGPLTVLRTRKDDGRALILYSDAAPARENGEDRERAAPEQRG